jgi:predicted alpha/beta-hydrolase family hydrolase
MGGRVSCHVALEASVRGVICFGYPLCAMGDRTKMRDAVLRELRRPILFLQGTRDSLCPLDLLENVRSGMTAPNQLYVIEGGDHSLRVRRKDGSQQVVDDTILEEIGRFISALTATGGM